MAIVKYKIGNMYVKIESKFNLPSMSMYEPFAVKNISNMSNISVEIKQIDIHSIIITNEMFLRNIGHDNTYVWIKKENHNYMIFAKRLQKLRDADWRDIWILDCNNEFENCILYISLCIDESMIVEEIFIRPWLQRLVIAYSSRSRFVLVHGALIDIEGTGIIFLGDSGSGKSTMCDLINNSNAMVIADDRFILDLSDGLVCFGTPWNMKNPHYSKNMSLSIEKVYILSHGNNCLKNIRSSYYDMVYGIFPAMLFPSFMKQKEIIAKKIRYLNYVKNKCEIYSFAFMPNASAIPYIIDPENKEFYV